MHLLVLLLASVPLVTGDKALLNCYDRIAGKAVANTAPLAELWHANPYECLHWCLRQLTNSGVRCENVVYHRQYYSCQLYGPVAQSTLALTPKFSRFSRFSLQLSQGASQGSSTAFFVPAAGHDLYQRKSYTGNCGSPGEPGATIRPTSPPIIIPSTLPPVLTPATPPPVFTPATIVTPFTTTKPATEFPVKDTTCGDHLTGYITALGYEFGDPSVEPLVIENVDDTFCAIACSDGTDGDGQDFECEAYAYLPLPQTCAIYPEKIEPDGDVPIVFEPDSIISQRVCIENAPIACAQDEIFLYFPGSTIDVPVDKNLITSTTNSLAECLKLCVANTRASADACKSVTYDAQSGECIQHSEDTLTEGVAVIERNPDLHYVENGCISNTLRLQRLGAKLAVQTNSLQVPAGIRQLPEVEEVQAVEIEADAVIEPIEQEESPSFTQEAEPIQAEGKEWSAWSSCEFKIRGQSLRVRTRNCTVYDCAPSDLEKEESPQNSTNRIQRNHGSINAGA